MWLMDNKLVDTFARKHNYLRVSLTDACNFRCQYCVAAFGGHHPNPSLMQAEEIEAIIQIFAELGVDRVRFTGGEPLVRRDSKDIFYRIGRLSVKLAITTNGYYLDKFLDCFEEIDLRSINVSLDTLDANTFQNITRVNGFSKVKGNIEASLQRNFTIKINVVVMKGVNDHELCHFVEWTRHVPVHVRFIEFMPFKENAWDPLKVMSYRQMMDEISKKFEFIKLEDKPNDTDKKYQVKGFKGTFAVISSVTEPFCAGCNRLRITADGKMKNCLFSQDESDLLTAYRNGKDIRPLILESVHAKFASYGGQKLGSEMNNRRMISIGG